MFLFSGLEVEDSLDDVARERVINLYVACGLTPSAIAARVRKPLELVRVITDAGPVQAARAARRATLNTGPWTREEEEEIEAGWEAGESDAALAARLNRGQEALRVHRANIMSRLRRPDGSPVFREPQLELPAPPPPVFETSHVIEAAMRLDLTDELARRRAAMRDAVRALAREHEANMPAPAAPRRSFADMKIGGMPQVDIGSRDYARLIAAGPCECIDCGGEAVVVAGEILGRKVKRQLRCSAAGCGRTWRQEIAR